MFPIDIFLRWLIILPVLFHQTHAISINSSTFHVSNSFTLLSNASQLFSEPFDISTNKYLKTSALLTCVRNSQFSSSYFEAAFFPKNNTLFFDIEAQTTISENITIKADLIAYGLSAYSKVFDLCGIQDNLLCPLKPGNIDLIGSYYLESSIASQIPDIAYNIPDLDTYIVVSAYSASDKEFLKPLACVQVMLSNGRTVQTQYLSWSLVILTIFGITVSVVYSLQGYTATSTRLASYSISLVLYFQNLAILAMISVSFLPPIVAAWTQNFQWSMGIIKIDFMQWLFDWYIMATSGSPTVVYHNKEVLSISVQKREWNSKAISALSNLNGIESSQKDTLLYTSNMRNTKDYLSKILVLRGIKRVSYKAGIELSNFFLTGFSFFIIFILMIIIGFVTFKVSLKILQSLKIETTRYLHFHINWSTLLQGTLYRVIFIAYPEISLLALWEFTQKDSAAALVESIVVFLLTTTLLSSAGIRIWRQMLKSKRYFGHSSYLLFSNSKFLNKFGFLYSQFKSTKVWWLMIMLTYVLIRSILVGALQTHGKSQSVGVFLTEAIYLIFLCWIRPYMDKMTNIFNIGIHLLNLINSFFFLFFSNLFRQPIAISSFMGIIFFFMNALFALYLFIFILVTFSMAMYYKNPDTRYKPIDDQRRSFLKNEMNYDAMYELVPELHEMKKAVLECNGTRKPKISKIELCKQSSDSEYLYM
ncbi:YOR365C [Saccharomyces arboricola H-6]|uniref:YOR365C n=1 Tax=Saccharomyces arboricola (strain H-6 / AS 2.3317 / CBS 10644) TaxID=1160507 RepID=J8PHF4_SACAR|nr:YOR365C [Saccharomyces arboricola H-6]